MDISQQKNIKGYVWDEVLQVYWAFPIKSPRLGIRDKDGHHTFALLESDKTFLKEKC